MGCRTTLIGNDIVALNVIRGRAGTNNGPRGAKDEFWECRQLVDWCWGRLVVVVILILIIISTIIILVSMILMIILLGQLSGPFQ